MSVSDGTVRCGGLRAGQRGGAGAAESRGGGCGGKWPAAEAALQFAADVGAAAGAHIHQRAEQLIHDDRVRADVPRNPRAGRAQREELRQCQRVFDEKT